jgi:hypothetical protein
MIDASVLINPVNAGGVGSQQLPAPSAQDVKRFEDALTQVDTGANAKQASVLTITEPKNESLGGFKQAIMDKVQVMDDSYHKVLSEYHEMPHWRDSVKIDTGNNTTDQMRSYPEVQSTKGSSDQINNTAQSVADNILSAAAQQNKIYEWGTKMEIWFSHMKIISAAVGQVSQGFKTLFQAG